MRFKPALLVLGFGLCCWVFAQKPGAAPERPAQFSARGTHGAIAAGSGYATDAAMRMYYSGGNAVDAGVASIFAAATTEYSHVGWGGEAPILIRTKDGKVHAIAGVGTMPKLATAEFYRNRPLQLGEVLEPPEKNGLKGIIPVAGLMAALVPSLPEAAMVALRDYGTKSFSEAVAPAIEFADGSAIDEMRAGAIQSSREFFTLWPTSQKHFMPDGRVPLPGEIFRQPDLARSLRGMVAAEKKVLAAGGSRTAGIDAARDYFYRGEIAKQIDEFSRAHGGLLRYDDMAAFKLTPEEPVSTEFHGARVYKPGFWSQGPAMIETLNILSGMDVTSMRVNSAQYIHTLTEALKLAYADRDTYYGDPKFVKIPEELLSMKYAEARRAQIGQTASLEFLPGKVGNRVGIHPSQSEIVRTKIDDFLMAHDTTCVDAIDKDGIMFSATPSGAWLPSVIAGDTGIPLTERAQSFLLVPGNPNELAGGKRPRVTLSPTLVTHTDGTPWLVLSTPGGDNQEQALIQLLFDVVLFRMNSEQAIEMPRFETRHLVSSFDNHAMNPGDLQLDDRTPEAVIANLASRGHKIGTRTRWQSGSAPGLVRVTPGGVIEAGADPWGYRSMRAY
ncbi:MAG TPA: gamma-glutamyltransferase [Bryobacteraceae bacterium]|jgi:gamma-glutamyltranspeptidase/glutathione hydrolase|nr:gamma-glutamyltransferase [Bryobacteraceae bacterium]